MATGSSTGAGHFSASSENEKMSLTSYGTFDGKPAPSGHVTAGFKDAATVSLAFFDLSYVVPVGWGKRRKVILDNVSGILKPGLNAILGPTGSGKTTLLDILADRKGSSRVSGTVLVNGGRRTNNFRFITGYVVQDDVVTGTLTVRENLHFSAALRLPATTSWQQRRERVEQVIDDLALQACANQKIGTEFIRGVSGGERKRTNIGMELIIEPQVLFLDEPTTGLDAHTAVSVVERIKQLSISGNRIVVMSIHQPRYSIFKLFDSLTLLSLGSQVYHGPARQALAYFNKLNFVCEQHDNPADFLLDVLTQCEAGKTHREVVGTEGTPMLVEEEGEGEGGLELARCYAQSQEQGVVQSELQPLLARLQERELRGGARSHSHALSYATSFLWQFIVVAYRSLLKMWRNPMTNFMQIMVMVIFALVVGGIYFQRDQSPRGLEDRSGAIFFIIMSQVFGNLGAIEVFIQDKAAFLHENSNGYYRVSVFFAAKVLTDVLLLRAGPLSVFSVIVYFMIGFKVSVENFFVFYLTLALTTLSGTALAFAFSAMVNVFAVANLLVSLVFILYMVFGGFLIGLNSIPSWIDWMKYLSIFRYAIEALSVNEFLGQVYNGTLAPNETCPYVQEGNFCVVNGSTFLEYRGYQADWVWWDQLALGGTALLWLALAYVILRAVKIYYRNYR